MNWLFELQKTNYTAQAIAIIALVCMAGMVLGSFQFRRSIEPLYQRTLVVDNPNLDVIAIDSVPVPTETGFVISRNKSARAGDLEIATGESRLHHRWPMPPPTR